MFKYFKKHVSVIPAATFAVCIISCAISNFALAGDEPIFSQTNHIELFPDGYAICTTESTQVNESGEPIETSSFINSNDITDKVLDEKGNELPLEVSRQVDNGESYYLYIVKLNRTVQPGEKYTLMSVSKKFKEAQKQGDIWVYDRNHMPIPETNYTETVKLPSGAKLISVQPEPAGKSEENGSIVLIFKKHLKRNETFKCRVEYRGI